MNKIMVGTILTVGLCLDMGSVSALGGSTWKIGKNDKAADAQYREDFGQNYAGSIMLVSSRAAELANFISDMSDRKGEIDPATCTLANNLGKNFKGIIEFFEGISEKLKVSKENSTALKAANKSLVIEGGMSDLITPQTVSLGLAQPLILLSADFVQSMSEVPLLIDNTETQEFCKIGAVVTQELRKMWIKFQQLDPSSYATLAPKVLPALDAGEQKFSTAAPVNQTGSSASYSSTVSTPAYIAPVVSTPQVTYRR
jgi:hypothetical protein